MNEKESNVLHDNCHNEREIFITGGPYKRNLMFYRKFDIIFNQPLYGIKLLPESLNELTP